MHTTHLRKIRVLVNGESHFLVEDSSCVLVYAWFICKSIAVENMNVSIAETLPNYKFNKGRLGGSVG